MLAVHASPSPQVLIAGAGPVGLAAALNLARRGIAVTVLEAGGKIADDPRAGTIHPPTLELFALVGATDAMIERGYVVRNYQYRDRRTGVIADFDLGVLADDTPHPYRLMLEQHKICHILLDMLVAYPNCTVSMEHRVLDVAQDNDGVTVSVETSRGVQSIAGSWMIGCDGGRSQVRKCMNVAFDGFTYEERFLILSTRYDFAPFGYALTNYVADPDEWCALFKVPGHDNRGIWRVVFPVDGQQAADSLFAEADVQRRVQRFHRKDGDYDVIHRNLYSVHQRVATRYRDGRLLLAGDAAHVNNPLGGMGMNFGLHDAFNLCEKLAAVMLENADEALLDLYDRQRRTVAQEFLQRQTIDNKRNIEQKSPHERTRFYDELRSIVADRDKLRTYLLRASMIEGFRRGNAIT